MRKNSSSFEGNKPKLWKEFEDLKKKFSVDDLPKSEEIKQGDIQGEFQRINS
jgi:hypothetical protein